MFIDVLRQTIMITSLVLVMMLLIEYLNVLSRGQWGKKLLQSKFQQILFSTLLGLVPGCIGGFAVVSMFTHNLVNFGALVANMIASTGDESFFMFSTIPKTAIILNIIIFAIAILVGLIVNFFFKSYKVPYPDKTHLVIHAHELEEKTNFREKIAWNLKSISFQRSILIIGLLMFLFGVITGQFEHGNLSAGHSPKEGHSENIIETALFIALSLIVLYVLLIVDEHFLEEHLWGHIIKKHFLKIFLWTFGALIGIALLMKYVDLEPYLHANKIAVLLVAVVIGIIPESGPNLIFILLYSKGAIPLSILIANSIVQDGHSALPLLAESKKSFFLMKGINLLVGLAVGMVGYIIGW